MKLNDAKINHYRSEMIPLEELKYKVALNKEYLKEKPTWYEINGKLQYFKIRNDFRLFTEQFYSMFAREILDIDSLEYEVAYVRTKSIFGKSKEEITKCGLLSDNFQTIDYNYYLVSELLNSQLSDFIMYGGYSLQSLLSFFKDYLDNKEYKENELFLIKLFIGDGFTHQVDRNYNNISFKVPKIDGVPYTKRLHPELLKEISGTEVYYRETEDGKLFLKDVTPTKLFDNERILGFDHKNVFNYKKGEVWMPLFPYSNDTFFETEEQAIEKQEEYLGLDPNLCELYINHPDICKPYFERLAYDDEYRKILERFQGDTRQINLNQEEIEMITDVLEDKREVFKRILKF